MTLILICVFGVAAGSPGTPKVHVLTATERARVESVPVDDSCDSEICEAKELTRARAMRAQMCKESFGKYPDLSWFETREVKGGRS